MIVQETPTFYAKYNTKEIQREKVQAYLVSLTQDIITDDITMDCVCMTKSKEFLASLCVINLVKKVLTAHIATDERFWGQWLNLSKIT